MDGKRLRGTRTPELPAVHLLSALSQDLGLVLGQIEVAETTTETGAVVDLFEGLVLTDRVVTVNALLTQWEVATTLLQKGALPNARPGEPARPARESGDLVRRFRFGRTGSVMWPSARTPPVSTVTPPRRS